MTDSIATLMPAAALAAPSQKREDPAKIKAAATQFEALLIGELFKTAREAGSGEGWLGTGDDEAGEIGSEMAEQQVARALAASGGFGLAKMIAHGLEAAQKPATGKASASPAPAPTGTREGSGG